MRYAMNVLIDDVHSAIVLENLKGRPHDRRRAGPRVESILFPDRPSRDSAKFCFCCGDRLGPIRDLAVRRIDDHVRAFEARVRVVLGHPDAAQVRSRFCGQAHPLAAAKSTGRTKLYAKVSSCAPG